MKKTILVIFVLVVALNAYCGYFNFGKPKEIDFRLLYYQPFFTEDVNQDKIPDVVGHLYKGSPLTQYDSTIDPGIYLSIQDTFNRLRPVLKFSESYLNGWEDMNQDGKKDIIFGKKDSVIIYYRIDSTTFNRVSLFTNGNINTHEITIQDIDGNGTKDIFSKNYFQNNNTPNQHFLLIQPTIDSFVLVPLISNGTYNVSGKILPGYFNADAKLDFMVYFPQNGSHSFKKAFLYTQVNQYQFAIKTLYLSNIPIAMRVLDKNKDGIDDIVLEYIQNNQRYLQVNIKTTDSFRTEIILTKLDSSAFPSNDPFLIQTSDLNCDGYAELFRSSGSEIEDQFIYEYKTDSLFQSPVNVYYPGSDLRFKNQFLKLYDYDFDGRPDIILTNESGQMAWCRNNSYSNPTAVVNLQNTYDTTYADLINKFGDYKTFVTYIPSDTSFEKTYLPGKKLNPQTGKVEPCKIVTTYRYIKGSAYDYHRMQVRQYAYKLVSSFTCQSFQQDTIIEISLYNIFNQYTDTTNDIIIAIKVIGRDTLLDNQTNIETTYDFDKKILKVFPNPAVDYFTIDGQLDLGDVSLFNSLGQSFRISPDERGYYPVMELPNGLFFLYLKGDTNAGFFTLWVNH